MKPPMGALSIFTLSQLRGKVKGDGTMKPQKHKLTPGDHGCSQKSTAPAKMTRTDMSTWLAETVVRTTWRWEWPRLSASIWAWGAQVYIVRIDQKVRDELTSWPSPLPFLPFPQESLPPGTAGRASTPGHAPTPVDQPHPFPLPLPGAGLPTHGCQPGMSEATGTEVDEHLPLLADGAGATSQTWRCLAGPSLIPRYFGDRMEYTKLPN